MTVVAFEDCRRAVSLLGQMHRFIRERADVMCLATTADDIRRAKADGRLAVLIQFQGTHAMEYEVDLLEVYWRLGARVIQLTYNQRSPVGDGCEEPGNAGLSGLGIAAVREMNRLGIVVDVSHTGERTSLDAVEVSSAPVIASHSNAAALHATRRNISDELIKALAGSGGLIGVNGFSAFVGPDSPATLDQYIDHISYIGDLVGTDHVALGLDYTIRNPPMAIYEQYVREGIWQAETYPPPPWHYPTGLDDASQFPNLTARLLERGFSEQDVQNILGQNWLRVLDDVARLAPAGVG